MFITDRAVIRSALLAVGLMAAPVASVAQEQPECEFEGSAGANTAIEALDQIDETSTPEGVMAAYQEAYDALESELDDDNAVVLLLAAQAQIGLGNFMDARQLLDRYDEVAPGPACKQHSDAQRQSGWVQLYNRGVQAYGEGDHEAALEAFTMANDFHPDLRSFSNTALLYAEMGQTEQAIATYREALEADIENPDPEQLRDVIRGLGDLLVQEGRGGEALEAYASYLEQYPDDVVIQIRYAGALADGDDTEAAEAIYADIMDRTNLGAQQWVEVGVGLYNARSYAEAAEAFANARQTNPYNKEAMENLVNASVLANQPGPVIALADTLVDWYPYDESNYQLLASALARSDQQERAMEIVNAAETTDLIFHSVQMAPTSTGDYVIRGSLESRGEGGPVTIPFELLDQQGQVVGTETLSTTAPPSGERESFRIEVSSDVPLAGFRYKKTSS